MKSRTKSCVQERDVKSDLDTIINEATQEFRKQLVKRKELSSTTTMKEERR